MTGAGLCNGEHHTHTQRRVRVWQDVGGWWISTACAFLCACVRAQQEKHVIKPTSASQILSASFVFVFCSPQPLRRAPSPTRETPTKSGGCGCARASLGAVLNKQEIISSIYCRCASNGCLRSQINKKGEKKYPQCESRGRLFRYHPSTADTRARRSPHFFFFFSLSATV